MYLNVVQNINEIHILINCFYNDKNCRMFCVFYTVLRVYKIDVSILDAIPKTVTQCQVTQGMLWSLVRIPISCLRRTENFPVSMKTCRILNS